MESAHLRRRILVELCSLGLATTVFLLLFPDRAMAVNMGLAGIALTGLIVNRRFTQDQVWSRFPVDLDRSTRLKKSSMAASIVTGIGVLGCLIAAAVLGYSEDGWSGVTRRLSNPDILIAIVLYLPWALLQQTLFQFYLLGRLLVIHRAWVAIVITGLAYSLVHLPHTGVSIATAGAGIIWTALYYRYRCLTPLAASHALLGSTFYYWVYNRDLMALWSTWNL
jgi:membrane protease YdiL (CAAX protease family)